MFQYRIKHSSKSEILISLVEDDSVLIVPHLTGKVETESTVLSEPVN